MSLRIVAKMGSGKRATSSSSSPGADDSISGSIFFVGRYYFCNFYFLAGFLGISWKNRMSWFGFLFWGLQSVWVLILWGGWKKV